MNKIIKKPLATAIGAAFLASVAVPVLAETNPFTANRLGSGYDLVNKAEAEAAKTATEGTKTTAEGKCGEGMEKTHAEGKCGDMEKCKAEGKCGEGKCGDPKKCEANKAKITEEKPAAASKATDEGKCGEGMCGSM